jgi:hypothetical protein
MKNLTYLFSLLFLPLFGMGVDSGGGGGEGGGDKGGGGGGAGDGGDKGGGGGSGNAFDIRQHIDDAGSFKPGWHTAAGVSEAVAKKFSRPEALAKSYESLERQIGAKGIIPPGPNATQAERDAFYVALGRPEKADGYGLTTKPDKIGDRAVPAEAWDQARAAKWQDSLFKLGVPKETALAIVNQATLEAMDGMDAFRTQSEAHLKASKDALAKEWGTDYDTNMADARRAAEKFGGKALIDHPGLGNDPVMIRALAAVGKQMVERPGAGARETGGSGKMNAAEARAEGRRLTQEIATRTKADRQFPASEEGRAMAARKTELFKTAFPEG